MKSTVQVFLFPKTWVFSCRVYTNRFDVSLKNPSVTALSESGAPLRQPQHIVHLKLYPNTGTERSPTTIPIPSMWLVYLPTWMAQIYGKCW